MDSNNKDQASCGLETNSFISNKTWQSEDECKERVECRPGTLQWDKDFPVPNGFGWLVQFTSGGVSSWYLAVWVWDYIYINKINKIICPDMSKLNQTDCSYPTWSNISNQLSRFKTFYRILPNWSISCIKISTEITETFAEMEVKCLQRPLWALQEIRFAGLTAEQLLCLGRGIGLWAI